jgi:hypothetical protein
LACQPKPSALSDEEIIAKQRATQAYHHLAIRCRRSLVPVQPLSTLEAKRSMLDLSVFTTTAAETSGTE